MRGLTKLKKLFYFTVAAGIVGFSVYGVYHTAHAYNNINTPPAGGPALSVDAAGAGNEFPDGSVCSPLGCAACGACIFIQYGQNVKAVPDMSLSEGLD